MWNDRRDSNQPIRRRGNSPGRSTPTGDVPHSPEQIADVLQNYLKESGLERRIEQAAVIPEWPTLVGATIAAITEPLFVTADGTLFVAVHTHAWMSELQLMAPQLIAALNTKADRAPVRKLRFQIRRDDFPEK